MSNSYTTTTSATGMPSLDIEYRRTSSGLAQDDRMCPSRTPSPKPNRTKSYAGFYNASESRREFIKSRSFCQASPPIARRSSLLKEQFDVTDGGDFSIFKTELTCAESSFKDNDLNDNDEDDDLFESQVSSSLATTSEASTKEEESTKTDDSTKTESQDESFGSNASSFINVPRKSSAQESDFNMPRNSCAAGSLTPISKAECQSNSSAKISPLANRKLDNLNLAQVAPVRKNSRDESAMRRASRDSHGSRRSSCVNPSIILPSECQQELAISCSDDIKNCMGKLLEWGFPIFNLSEKCHVLTQVLFLVLLDCLGFLERLVFQLRKLGQLDLVRSSVKDS